MVYDTAWSDVEMVCKNHIHKHLIRSTALYMVVISLFPSVPYPRKSFPLHSVVWLKWTCTGINLKFMATGSPLEVH